MNENQVRGVIAEAKKLSDIYFESFKKDFENTKLSLVKSDQQKFLCLKQRTKVSSLLMKFPSYLNDAEDDLITALSVNLEEISIQHLHEVKPEINAMFKPLYKVYRLILYDDFFMILLSKNRAANFHEEFYYYDRVYQNCEDVSYLCDSDETTFESYFYTTIHEIVLTYFYYTSKKFDYYNNIISGEEIYGIDCQFDEAMKLRLFNGCKDYIDSLTTFDNFKAALTKDKVPYNFTPVKWIVTRGNSPNQQSLGALIKVATDFRDLDRKKIKDCFRDINGDEFNISKLNMTPESFKKFVKHYANMLPEETKRLILAKYYSETGRS